MDDAWLLMVVDDDWKLLRALERILAAYGFLTILAPDAQTALHLAQRIRPDVYLIDVLLGRTDGRDLALQLGAWGGVRFLTSAHVPESEMLRTVERGRAEMAIEKAADRASPLMFVDKYSAVDKLRVHAGACLRMLGRKPRGLPAGTLQPAWLDMRRNTVFSDHGVPIPLSPQQFQLVYALSLQRNIRVSLDWVCAVIDDTPTSVEALKCLVKRTKARLRDGGTTIQIEWRAGLRLTVPEGCAYESRIVEARLKHDPATRPIFDPVLQAQRFDPPEWPA